MDNLTNNPAEDDVYDEIEPPRPATPPASPVHQQDTPSDDYEHPVLNRVSNGDVTYANQQEDHYDVPVSTSTVSELPPPPEVQSKVTEVVEARKENAETGFQVSPAFQGSGQKAGIEIWRIEALEPVKQDPKSDGIFHKGDAYIVLATVEVKGSNKLEHHIHFWLGEECSQDESGTAAIRAVELDEGMFGGAAVQHREVQNHESKLFLGYFKKGIRYLDGGVKSGFKEAQPDKFPKRLFQLKGKRNIRTAQVECKCASLNQGDTFVLDNGRQLYVWFGPKSNRKEKLGGVELAKRIRDEERGGRAKITTIENDWDHNDQFFKALGSKDKVIRAADDTPDDDIVRKFEQEIILYRIEADKSKPKGVSVTEEAGRPLKGSVLNSKHCYCLDVGTTGIFLWTGKGSAPEFRKTVWQTANEFMETRGYPKWVTVTRVMEGAETSLFIQHFAEWPTHMVEPTKGNVAKSDYSGASGVDVEELHKHATVQEFCPDDGSGKKQVWRIKNMELEVVKENIHGIFFGGDSYVIQYDYTENRKSKYIIYFWQGSKSSQDEQGAAAAHTVKLDDKLGGSALQIRIVMNKEPKHFMKIFGGRLIIFDGGHASGFQGVEDFEGYDPKATYMFQIRGTTEAETRAVQVTARAASLNRNDVFVVRSPKKCFVWVGQNANDAEKEMAKYMVKDLAPKKPNVIVLKESEEDNSFWSALGGEEPYHKGPVKKEVASRTPPRLFKCSQASGRFTVEEIAAFAQEDLDDDEVMLLDTYDEIFLWVGKNASDFEKKESMKTAYLYLESDPTHRTKDNTLIICVRQGFEPPQFTGCFLAWDADLWNQGKTFQEIIDEVGKENAGINLVEEEKKKFDKTYTLDILQRHPPPEYIDVTHKEMYLSDEDFVKIIGMTKDAWEHQPEWKKINKKKQLGLF